MFFAFLTSPFPSHLGQMSMAIAELLRRGHKVEIWGDESSRRTADRLNAGYRLVRLPHKMIGRVTGFGERPRDYYEKFAFPLVAEQLPQTLALCQKYAPDVIHSNSRIYTAAIASRLIGVICSNHCCSGLSFGLIPEDLFGFHLAGDEPPRKRELMVAMNRKFHEEIDSLFERIVTKPMGIARVDNVLGLISDKCVLVLSCQELANPRLAALPQTAFTGPLISQEQSRVRNAGDYCYVSLGTWPLEADATINLYRRIIAGIPRCYRVVVGLGGRFEPDRLGILDPRITIMKYAPQEEMIRGADVVICHGGCQTVHEGLYFGKPLVITPPSLAEPMELSHKVAGAGAGIVLDYRKLRSGMILQSVERVRGEKSFAQSSGEIGRSLRILGGVDLAVRKLEGIAANPTRVKHT